MGARKAPTDPQTSRKCFWAASAVAEEACVACIVPQISTQWCLSQHSVTGSVGATATGDVNQFTFLVFRTHQGSQQTITGKTTYTKH